MKLITTRLLIQKVAERWEKQYPKGSCHYEDKKDILLKLQAIDANTATADDVKNISGNSTWTSIACNECGKNVDAVVECGEPQDYESNTAYICKECLTKAVQLAST